MRVALVGGGIKSPAQLPLGNRLGRLENRAAVVSVNTEQAIDRGKHFCAGNSGLVCPEVPMQNRGAVVELGNLRHPAAAAIAGNIFVAPQVVGLHCSRFRDDNRGRDLCRFDECCGFRDGCGGFVKPRPSKALSIDSSDSSCLGIWRSSRTRARRL